MALLKSVGKRGSICTYTGYERTVLAGLADALPHLRKDLLQVCDRLWDLHTALLKYCERDTLAMVELRRALRLKARS